MRGTEVSPPVDHPEARRGVGFTWLLAGALFLNLGLAVSYVVLWVGLARQGVFWRADFTAFYTGGAIVSDGQGARLYDPDLHARYQRRILGGRKVDGLLRYDYPPPAAVLLAPLARLPRSDAFLAWTSTQLLWLFWLSRLLLRIASRWSAHERWLLMSALLAFPPLLFSFQLGAFSLLMVLCVVQAYLALKGVHDARAGLWLAVGTLKPQAVLMPALMLLGARRWRAVAAMSAAVAAMVVLSSLLLGWRIWPDFLRALGAVSVLFDAFGIVPSEMYNFKGALALCLGSHQSILINGMSAIALALAILATLVLWRRGGAADHPRFELRMALTILLGLLVSPHLYPQDSLMLVVPATMVYAYLREHDRPRRAYAALVLSAPLLFAISDSLIRERMGVRPPVVIMIVLTAWTAKLLADKTGPEGRARAPRDGFQL